MSFIDGEPRSAKLEAMTEVQALRISKEIFGQVVENPPDIAIGFMRDLSMKVRKATGEIEDFIKILFQKPFPALARKEQN